MRRWRRCLITTAPIEIAARAAIAIRIGTKGEDELSLLAVGVETVWFSLSEAVGCLAEEPLPGLPWPLPPLLPEPEWLLPPDGLFDEDPEPVSPVLPEPGFEPPAFEDSAGPLPPLPLLEPPFAGGVVCPLTVGTSVSYSGTSEVA